MLCWINLVWIWIWNSVSVCISNSLIHFCDKDSAPNILLTSHTHQKILGTMNLWMAMISAIMFSSTLSMLNWTKIIVSWFCIDRKFKCVCLPGGIRTSLLVTAIKVPRTTSSALKWTEGSFGGELGNSHTCSFGCWWLTWMEWYC